MNNAATQNDIYSTGLWGYSHTQKAERISSKSGNLKAPAHVAKFTGGLRLYRSSRLSCKERCHMFPLAGINLTHADVTGMLQVQRLDWASDPEHVIDIIAFGLFDLEEGVGSHPFGPNAWRVAQMAEAMWARWTLRAC